MINLDWYQYLNKPFLNPPNWIFAPVWTGLYITMAAALVLLLTSNKYPNKIKPVMLFALQLAFNLLWPAGFFYYQNIGLGLIIICLLWVTLLLTIKLFYKYSKLAAILLIPYFLWVTFALYLNFEVLRLN